MKNRTKNQIMWLALVAVTALAVYMWYDPRIVPHIHRFSCVYVVQSEDRQSSRTAEYARTTETYRNATSTGV